MTCNATSAGQISAIIASSALMATSARAQVSFQDVAAAAGVGSYIAQSGDGHGPGGVFTDLNNDGFPDLYLVSAFASPANRLYINTPDPTGASVFVRAPLDAGAGDTGNATGAIAGDYDNDGDIDLYVLNFDQPNALYQNQLAQTGVLWFNDVTAQTDPTPGVNDDQFGVGTAFFEGVALDNSLTGAWADVDRDGDLDLYVGNHNSYFGDIAEGPFSVPGRRDVFYLNNGDGTFTDATMLARVPGYITFSGLFQTTTQRFSSTNAVVFTDINNDGWPDLLVTNKIGGPTDFDMLYINLGVDALGGWLGYQTATYSMPAPFGFASGAAMGVSVADYDNDGDIDIYITDFSDPANTSAPGNNDLWINQLAETGSLSFTHSASLAAKFSWGAQWRDFDNDGRVDLHVSTDAGFQDFLYMNTGAGFTQVAQAAGVAQMRLSRGDIAADFNRDGWMDLFVVNLDGGPSALYKNTTASALPLRSFLSVKLLGDPAASATGAAFNSSRDTIGARVYVIADLDGDGVMGAGETQLREVRSGSSNAGSSSQVELTFGLGSAHLTFMRVFWPSGNVADFFALSNSFLVIDEANLIPGDLNADRSVNAVDLALLLGQWGACPGPDNFCPGDVNRDGTIGAADLATLIGAWGSAN